MDPNSAASLPNPALTAALEAREVDVSHVPVNAGPVPTFVPLAPLAPVTPEAPIQFTVPPAVTKPLVPGWAAMFAGLFAVLATPAAVLLPAPFGAGVAALGILAGALAGLPAKMPRFAEGRPLVPLALVPACGSASALLFSFATSLPEGKLKAGLFLGAALFAIAAGKASPAPVLPA